MAPSHLLLRHHHHQCLSTGFSLPTLSSLRNHRLSPFTATFATEPDAEITTPEPEQTPEARPTSSSDDPFESRLSNFRIRYNSGTGKKAELRKSKKSKASGKQPTTGSGSNVFLPPVPLKEPISVSAPGLKVDFGFTPYSEVVNGRLACLGLAALLAVELATGKGVINYHTPSLVFVQVYFVAAVTALVLKFEKEKVSVWPDQANDSQK